jgi:hypothetical protein
MLIDLVKFRWRFLEKFEAKAWMPRTHMLVYSFINVWSCPLRDLVEPIKRAYRAASESGDIAASAICAIPHTMIAFHAGQSIVELEKIVKMYCMRMDAIGQTFGLVFLVPFWYTVSGLIGSTKCSLSLSGQVVDLASACANAQKEDNKIGLFNIYIYQTMVSILTWETTVRHSKQRKNLESLCLTLTTD